VRFLPLILLCVLFADALARPGGGGGFSTGRSSSGGYHSSGGSSGGSSSGLFLWLFQLCIEQPIIGIPLLIAIVGFFIYTAAKANRQSGLSDWSTGSLSTDDWTPPAPRQREHSKRRELLGLRDADPNFSLVLFEDFLYALYHELHVARGAKKLERFSAYLGSNARAALVGLGEQPVADVIVGSLKLVRVWRGEAATEVTVDFGANMSEGGKSIYVEERWKMQRAAKAQSKPWSRARVLACPNCGAPAEQVLGGVCATCKEKVSDGRFDWVVTAVERRGSTEVPAIILGSAVEQGTEEATLVDDDAQGAWDLLGGNWTSFVDRVRTVFLTFQKAWSARDLKPMGPLLSDTLLATQERWMAAYKKAGLRNVTDGIQLTNVELSQVYSDRWFHAVIVRVSGEGPDFTVDAHDKVVGGSKTRTRAFTEYWTLIRSNATPVSDTRVVCPECGAELPLTMAGQCPYCKSQVTSASFEWVLSRIEQDEVYEL
jgi:hypothetical protein